MQDYQKLHLRKFVDTVREYAGRPFPGDATDEDVKTFINLFMRPTIGGSYNRNHTSYGLKHIAENVIGHLFYNSDNYAYVSNDQFKRCMNELHFCSRPTDDNSPNEYYKFKWEKELLPFVDSYNRK